MSEYLVMMYLDSKDDEGGALAFLENFSKLTGCSYQIGKKYGVNHSVKLTIDNDKIKKAVSRNAGRKPKQIDYTCADIANYRQNHTQKEAAALLGMSLRNYQRIEKSVKDAGFWNDPIATFMKYGK